MMALANSLPLRPAAGQTQSDVPDYSNIGRPVQGALSGQHASERPPESYDAFGLALSAEHAVRVWGEAEYELQRDSYENGIDELNTQHRLSVSLNAATYLIEPWIATLRGGVRFSNVEVENGPSSGNDEFVTGELGLSVFPRSRFPFEAHIESTDSRVSSGLGADYDYQSTRYGASQRYRSIDNTTRGSISVDHIEQDGERFGRTLRDLFELEGSIVPRRHHQVRGMLTHSDTHASERDLRNRYDTIAIRHRFDPSREFWLDNSANVTHTVNEFGQSMVDTRLAQIGSNAFWRPINSPLSMNGSWRLRTLERESQSATTRQEYVTGSLGASYLINRNLRWYGSMDGARTSSSVDALERYRLLAGFAYTADLKSLGKWEYDRFANLSVQHVYGNVTDRGYGGNLQLGHGLRRIFPAGRGAHYSVSVNQSLGAAGGDNYESSGILAHLLSAGWTKTVDTRTGYIRLSLADSRYLGDQQDVFQLGNIQANVDIRVGRFTTWSGSATWQATRNRVDQGFRPDQSLQIDTGWLKSASADLSYRRRMLFGVRDLSLLSRLRARRQELLSTITLYDERERYSWENRLEYLLGRLETQLLMRVAALDETRRWLLLFRVIRRFGF